MKIVLIGRFGEGEILSGPEIVARELFYELKNKNYQVTFIEYFFSDYKNSSLLTKLFGKKYFVENTILRLGVFPILVTIIKSRFDMIHIVNAQRFQLFLLLISRLVPGKIVTTLHGSIQNEFKQMKKLPRRHYVDIWVEKLITKKSSLLIFPSKLLFGIFNEQYQFSRNKYQVIPNGISRRFEIRNSAPIKFENTLRIVFYNGPDSTFNRGLQKLIYLLENVQVNIQLFVLGAEELVINNNRNVQISFSNLLGHDAMIQFLSDKQFVIKSTQADTFPGFVAECMCLGLIPIINKNIGMSEFIEDRENGFLYKINSTDDLSKLLEDIVIAKYDLNSISLNAKKIFEKLNWSVISNKYIDAYKSVL